MIIQTEPYINEKDKKILNKVIDRKFVTENKFTQQFEDIIKNLVKARYAISVSNWTAGIFCCLRALNIGKGDEVIVPDMTFAATSNAVLLSGAKVVLCDVNYNDYSINADEIVKKINSRTKAVIPVHLYGNFCDMEKILKIRKKYNIKIIEDAAQALGVQYKKKFAGTFGDCGGYSFYGNKIITSGEGGVIVTNNKKIRDEIYKLKNHGREKKGVFIHKSVGFNFMFTELQAALGITQLGKLNSVTKKRNWIFKKYKEYLNNKYLIKFEKKKYHINLHWFFNIKSSKINKILPALKKNKIEFRRLFYPLHLQPCYKNHPSIIKGKSNFDISKKLYKETISLPTFQRLKDKEIRFICKIINDLKI